MTSTDITIPGKVLITGTTGYIGQQLTSFLAERGVEVHALVRNRNGRSLAMHPNIHYHDGDIQDASAVKQAMHGCRYVFHIAALVRLVHKDPSMFYDINVNGTKTLLAAAQSAGVEKFIYTSTTGVIGPSLNKPMREEDPRIVGYDNDYEISKAMGESLVREFNNNGLPAVIVSPSRVYGPGPRTYSNGVNRFIQGFLKRGFSVIPMCADVFGNYVYIDDVIRGHILAAHHAKGGERYILGGENVSFGDFIKAIKHHANTHGVFIKLPKSMIKLAATTMQIKAYLLNQTPALTPAMVDRLFLSCSFSSEKAVAELGYTITPFHEGIHRTIAFLRNGTQS